MKCSLTVLFIQEYLSGTHCILGTILSPGNTSVNKTQKDLCPFKAYVLEWERWAVNIESKLQSRLGSEGDTGKEKGTNRGGQGERVEVEILNTVVWIGIIKKVPSEGSAQGREGGSPSISARCWSKQRKRCTENIGAF